MHTVSVVYYLDPPVVNVEILPGQDNELGKKNVLYSFFLAYMIFFLISYPVFYCLTWVKIKVG